MTEASLGKMPDHLGTAFDVLVDPLQGVVGPDFDPVFPGEAGESQDLCLGSVHQWAGLRVGGGELVADLVPRGGGGCGLWLGERGPERGGGHLEGTLMIGPGVV